MDAYRYSFSSLAELCAEAVMLNSPRIIRLCKFLPLQVCTRNVIRMREVSRNFAAINARGVPWKFSSNENRHLK